MPEAAVAPVRKLGINEFVSTANAVDLQAAPGGAYPPTGAFKSDGRGTAGLDGWGPPTILPPFGRPLRGTLTTGGWAIARSVVC